MKVRLGAVVLIASAQLAGCGGGGGGSSPRPITNHAVTISWAANHEKGVNSPGGGYHVMISGAPTIDVLFNGTSTPTSAPPVILKTGTYTVTVSAFAALDNQGGATGSTSAASQILTVDVP
jgi:hypothetical protein